MPDILFISDLHLAPERPDIIQLFLTFMDEQASSAKELYILGDLVEYWLGDDDETEALEPVFNKIRQAADKGLKIYLMHGNRDFLIGKDLGKRCGFTLIDDPYVADLNGTPAILMHGDTLCTDDVRYQELRKMLRNPAWQKDILSKPLTERIKIAKELRKQSQEETQLKDTDIMDVNVNTVNNVFASHDITFMIHGHTHRPNIHLTRLNNNDLTRIVLGDWYTKGSVLEFNNFNDFKLKEFN